MSDSGQVITGKIFNTITGDCYEVVLNLDLFSFDYVHLAKIWAFAFSSVLFFYFFSLGIGLILKLVKYS